MFAYAEDLYLTDRLSRLAREELRHYEQVAKLMRALKVSPRRLAPGRYAQELRRNVSRAEPQRELDLMICGAFIEARSCERFALLAPAAPAPLGKLFESLHAAEARHQGLYLDLAERAAQRTGMDLRQRIAEFTPIEAQLISAPDPVFRFHSGPPPGVGYAAGASNPPSV
jgi:tRNA-(ms[2]io[6]A)-hydroxylase